MEYLIEKSGVIDYLKAIVKSKKPTKIQFNNGETFICNANQAERILETYRELNSSNRVKFIILVNKNLTSFNRALTFSSRT